MATETPLQSLTSTGHLTRQHRSPLLERWHLLSLDAPTVATLWTWFIADSVHLRLPTVALVSMFLAVWVLYAADRLLDARQLLGNPLETTGLEPRHLFHHLHRRAFLIAIAIASLALAALLPHLPIEAIRLYLILGGLLAGYLILVHASQHARRLPKEIAVGLFFAAATFIPTVAREPQMRAALLAPAMLLAALCSLNCLFIYAWEHRLKAEDEQQAAHPVTRIALRHLRSLSVVLILTALATAPFSRSSQLTLACAAATLGLLLLDRSRQRITATTLRAAADLVLLSPLLFLLIRA